MYHGIVSLDLSAAFDMVNPDLLVERMKVAGIPNDVTELVEDWLKNRQAFVEVGGESSMLFDVPEGTVQGSVLGPVLFAIFISPLFDKVDASSYADDSYLSEKGQNLNELTNSLSRSATTLTNWFKSSGLVVNESKTELCVFHKNKKSRCTIRINDIIIQSTPTIKALGVILDENLNWEKHVQHVSNACQKINMGFKILKKYFTQQELLTLATSLYYSKMYYAAEVWLSNMLSVKSQRTLMTSSARILKTVSGTKCDQTDKVSFLELHKSLNRATPGMMTSYIQATCLHRIIHNEIPQSIYLDLIANHIETRRHYKPTFHKTNKTRVGLNLFRNRIQNTTNILQFDISSLPYTSTKVMAKRTFLTF